MTRSATKTIQNQASADRVFAFAANPANLPKWAIHNVKAIRHDKDGIWEMDTPRGPGRFVPRFQLELGILEGS